MKLLILGGTVFLGRHLVEAALHHGHEVTLFTRGQHGQDLFPECEKLRGDRDGDLDALAGRRWDAVIDTSGYVPRVVKQSAELLKDAAEHYTFISSISVYADFSQIGIDEQTSVLTLEEDSEDVSKHYGALKYLCEQEVEAAFPGKTLVVRPGLIVGPHDPTDRFTYWPYRIAKGGEVLAPGKKTQPVQFVDARDLAAWIVRMMEQKQTGVYNATGPAEEMTMQEFLETCKSAIGNDARFTWVDEEFLLEQGVKEWSDMPLWISEKMGWPGFLAVDCGKAIRSGLEFRALEETVRDTLVWVGSRKDEVGWKAGVSLEREKQVLSGRHLKVNQYGNEKTECGY